MNITKEQLKNSILSTIKEFRALNEHGSAVLADKIMQKIGKDQNEKPEIWPQLGDDYYFVKGDGEVSQMDFEGDDYDYGYLKLGNCFKTKEEAAAHRLRLESMANPYIPKDGEEVFVVSASGDIDKTNMSCFPTNMLYARIGRLHPTEESAKEWSKKYNKAWTNNVGISS